MTSEQLNACTKKVLAEMARAEGIAGWHAMRKEELLQALAKVRKKDSKSKATKPAAAAKPEVTAKPAANGKPTPPPAAKPRPQAAAARDTSNTPSSDAVVETGRFESAPPKDLSARAPKNLPTGYGKDRIVVMVRDPYWLHAYWELTHHAIQRAEAALGQDWHGAKPILRVFDVSSHDTTSTSETQVRDIEIHGGCNNWYIEVANPPRSFRVDIGYLSRRGTFFVLARSNIVSTPRAGVTDAIDANWSDIDAKQADRIFAMSNGFDGGGANLELKQLFEEHLRRPMNSPVVTSFGTGALNKPRKFDFRLDAELIVYGATDPASRVTLQGEPVKLRPDGTFTMRFALPDNRQIIPAVATSADGIEERTIVLAVERNTKYLEPLIHDMNDA